ncbi:MAG: amino acid ABC transporter substrate-binding protein [Anaerolineae bacterium]|nr:amino acid ABC transporter substrate-binding protein [Anaerolineae bacterium]
MRAARLIAAVLLLLCACSGPRSNPLKRIQSAGTLRVAFDPSFPPFEFVDGSGQVTGLDVDLARAIAARLGVDAHFVTTGYDALYDALTVGRADVIISALYPDPTRMQAFAFSSSYFNAGEVLVVPEDSSITGVPDLAGKQVAMVFGTEAHMVALQWEKTMPTPPVLMIGDAPETITSVLAAGIVDAVILDNVTAQMALGDTPGLRVLTPSVTDEPYTIAARKEDAKLLEAISAILNEMEASGELDALIQRWMQ